MKHATEDVRRAPTDPERRSFFARIAALIAGGVAALFPFAAGFGVITHPLWRGGGRSKTGNQGAADGFVPICPLESLPADGRPHGFVVTADVVDAWTRALNQRIGEVFLARTDAGGKPDLTAFTATCPHLGCTIEFAAEQNRFECPCHASGFGTDGKKLFGPSLRGLDKLEVKLINDNGAQHIWVRFQRFRAGIAKMEPVA